MNTLPAAEFIVALVITGVDTTGIWDTARSEPDKPVTSADDADVKIPYGEGLWCEPDEVAAAAAADRFFLELVETDEDDETGPTAIG